MNSKNKKSSCPCSCHSLTLLRRSHAPIRTLDQPIAQESVPYEYVHSPAPGLQKQECGPSVSVLGLTASLQPGSGLYMMILESCLSSLHLVSAENTAAPVS